MLRIIRVARIIKVVGFLKPLKVILLSIIGSMAAQFWALIFLLVSLYLFALFFMQGVEMHFRTVPQHEICDSLLYLHYGTVGHTMFTLFLGISGGGDWGQLVEPLVHIHEAYKCLYAFFVCFMVFALMNILTGIFVLAAQDATQETDQGHNPKLGNE